MTVMPGTDVPSDPFDERLIEADALSPEDREFDVALRPRTLDEFVGQDDLNPVLADWGQGTPPGELNAVPEPGALSLMSVSMLGLLFLYHRRR